MSEIQEWAEVTSGDGHYVRGSGRVNVTPQTGPHQSSAAFVHSGDLCPEDGFRWVGIRPPLTLDASLLCMERGHQWRVRGIGFNDCKTM
jgi:hypothetical protein